MTSVLERSMEAAAAAWTSAMRRGDFGAAWRIADVILTRRKATGPCWDWPRHAQWVWDGRALVGQRVLVRCYHGLGDTIQFARFLPRLVEICRELTVWVQPAVLPLLGRMNLPLKLLPLHDGTPEIDYDVDIEIMELAHALRTTVQSLPSDVPYFSVQAERRQCSERCVGLMAQTGDWDPRRDVPTELVAELAEVPGMRTFNLQLDLHVPGATDISTPDVLTLAARICALDLVITADTMTAHLAGALAIPTWTLLPAEADWRWMTGRGDSPWYPTMRLFRQPSPGDWVSVLGRVRAELGE
jgi:hypothetical protein